MRDHLEHAARRGHAKAIADLTTRPLAPHLRAIWEQYLSLQRWRGGGGMGPSAMTAPDLVAFCALTGAAFTPWQVDCLKALDLTQLTIVAEE